MINSIADLLTPELVHLDVTAQNACGAITKVAGQLKGNPAVADHDAFVSAVLSREKVSPTVSPQGVAFPHARTACVSRIVMAIGRSPGGLTYENCANKIHLIFLIGTPPESAREYLALLGGLARLVKEEKVRRSLLEAGSAEELIEAIRRAG
jgi:mannitol/fructose-specific phosphotransferase system IIA component (Ntr-type)